MHNPSNVRAKIARSLRQPSDFRRAPVRPAGGIVQGCCRAVWYGRPAGRIFRIARAPAEVCREDDLQAILVHVFAIVTPLASVARPGLHLLALFELKLCSPLPPLHGRGCSGASWRSVKRQRWVRRWPLCWFRRCGGGRWRR